MKHTLTDIENKITEVICHAGSKYILKRYNRKDPPLRTHQIVYNHTEK